MHSCFLLCIKNVVVTKLCTFSSYHDLSSFFFVCSGLAAFIQQPQWGLIRSVTGQVKASLGGAKAVISSIHFGVQKAFIGMGKVGEKEREKGTRGK